jgi:hypothetical protein
MGIVIGSQQMNFLSVTAYDYDRSKECEFWGPIQGNLHSMNNASVVQFFESCTPTLKNWVEATSLLRKEMFQQKVKDEVAQRYLNIAKKRLIKIVTTVRVLSDIPNRYPALKEPISIDQKFQIAIDGIYTEKWRHLREPSRRYYLQERFPACSLATRIKHKSFYHTRMIMNLIPPLTSVALGAITIVSVYFALASLFYCATLSSIWFLFPSLNIIPVKLFLIYIAIIRMSYVLMGMLSKRETSRNYDFNQKILQSLGDNLSKILIKIPLFRCYLYGEYYSPVHWMVENKKNIDTLYYNHIDPEMKKLWMQTMNDLVRDGKST